MGQYYDENYTCIARKVLVFIQWFIVVFLLVLVISHIVVLKKAQPKNELTKKSNLNLLLMSISAAAGLGWIIVWGATVGYDSLSFYPLCLLGLMWPILMSIFDIAYLRNSANSSIQAQGPFAAGHLQGIGGSVIGISFAIGSLLTSSKFKSTSQSTTPLLMYSLVLLIAFVVPIPGVNPTSETALVIGDVQRASFNWAIGFLLTALTVNASAYVQSQETKRPSQVKSL